MHKNATIDRTNVLSIGRTKQKTNFVSSFFYLLHFLDIVLRFELNAQFSSIEPERHTKKKMCDAFKKLEVVRVYQLVFVHFSVFYVQTKKNMLKRELNKAIFAIFFFHCGVSKYVCVQCARFQSFQPMHFHWQ